MTVDHSLQKYLNTYSGGDAELRHTFDPLDYDGCPFQRLALVFAKGPATEAPQAAQAAVSGAATT